MNLSKTKNKHKKFKSSVLKKTARKYQEENKEAFNHLREHEFILADKQRVAAYHAAIFRFINPGDVVIDLGTGAGILAFFASQRGAKKVYAIDHSNIISIAKRVAEFNKLNNIEFVQIHSRQLVLDSFADAIIHEQMGNFLFDERMIENVCDLRDRLLKEGGRIIPDKFELFIEPVKMADIHHIPMIKEMKINGIDFSCIQEKGVEELYSYIWRADPAAVDFFLCEPKSIYSLNIQTITPSDLPHAFDYSRAVKRAGRLDGFVVYFKSIFDDDLFITSGPFLNRATSWKYYLLRVPSIVYKKGDIIKFHLRTSDISNPATWQWELES